MIDCRTVRRAAGGGAAGAGEYVWTDFAGRATETLVIRRRRPAVRIYSSPPRSEGMFLRRPQILANEYRLPFPPLQSLAFCPYLHRGRTEAEKMACTWFGEIPSCCSLTLLLGPAWVLLNYVLQTIFSGLVL